MKNADIYLGDEAFQILLFEIKCPYYVEEIRAYILGATLSTEGVTPNEAIDFLLKDDEGEELYVSNQGKYQEFTHQFFALWNEIAKYSLSDFVPPFSNYPFYFQSDEEMLQAAATRANEIKLFLLALLEGTHSCQIEDEKISHILYLLEGAAEKIHQAVLRLHDSYEEKDEDLIDSEIAEINDMWHYAYPQLKKFCLELKKDSFKGKENNVIRADFGRKTTQTP